MNIELGISIFLQTAVVTLLFILAAFLLHRFLKWVAKNNDITGEFNTSLKIYFAALITASTLFLTNLSQALTTVIKIYERQNDMQATLTSSSFYLVLFFIICVVGIFLAITLSNYVYTITIGDSPLKKIANDDIGASILCSILTVAIAFLFKDNFIVIFDSIIPYPEGPALF